MNPYFYMNNIAKMLTPRSDNSVTTWHKITPFPVQKTFHFFQNLIRKMVRSLKRPNNRNNVNVTRH